MNVFPDLGWTVHAGASVVQIISHEWARVRSLSLGLATDLGLPYEYWSSSAGLARWDLSDKTFHPCNTPEASDPAEVLRAFHRRREPGVLLLEDIHPFLDPSHRGSVEMIRWLREICRLDADPRKVVLLNTLTSTLPMELEKEVPTLELPLPRGPELQAVISQVAQDVGVAVDSQDESLLDAARGLTLMEARQAYGKAAVRARKLDAHSVPLVAEEKERIIRRSSGLEFCRPEVDLASVGGSSILKDWLRKRSAAFSTSARQFGLDSPRGLLLLGVQGCGKSLAAKAVAAEWRFPLLRLDLGRIFAGLVGASESNMRNALKVAEALAPCILWIDEIEKGMAGLGSSDVSDAGTTARVVGFFLTWMQERKSPVFVVATANRIRNLPPELLRKGRFDEIFFVDLPDRATRREILSIHLRRRRRNPASFDLDSLAEASEGFSGAELEEAVREGLYEAFDSKCELQTGHIHGALRSTAPLSRTMAEEVEELRRWAQGRARNAGRPLEEALS